MNPEWPTDFEALGRQYMEALQKMMRGATAGQGAAAPGFMPPGFVPPGFASAGFATPGFGTTGFGTPGFGTPGFSGVGGWQDPSQAWTRAASQFTNPEAMASMHRFNAQSNGWYAQMHELAAKFADQSATAKTVAEEWKKMLESTSGNVMADALKNMQSGGSHGFESWYASIEPMLNGWKQEFSSWLNVPTFGLAREHQERLQKLLQSQMDYQEALTAHNTLLGNSGEAAMKYFEAMLEKHGDGGKPITTARALFDTWVDAAEQAYAQVALSGEYRKVYADMVNAQMRLRAGVQREIEQACDQLGVPTRTEMDAAHRKIAELERALRRARVQPAQADGQAQPRTERTAAPANRAAAKKAAPKKAASNKAAPKKASAQKVSSKKVAAKKKVAPTRDSARKRT